MQLALNMQVASALGKSLSDRIKNSLFKTIPLKWLYPFIAPLSLLRDRRFGSPCLCKNCN